MERHLLQCCPTCTHHRGGQLHGEETLRGLPAFPRLPRRHRRIPFRWSQRHGVRRLDAGHGQARAERPQAERGGLHRHLCEPLQGQHHVLQRQHPVAQPFVQVHLRVRFHSEDRLPEVRSGLHRQRRQRGDPGYHRYLSTHDGVVARNRWQGHLGTRRAQAHRHVRGMGEALRDQDEERRFRSGFRAVQRPVLRAYTVREGH